MLVMHRRRLPQIGKAHHGRILVPAIDHGVCRLLAHIQRARIIGKALSEVHGLMGAGQTRHHLEDGSGQGGIDGIEPADGGHGRTRGEGDGHGALRQFFRRPLPSGIRCPA